VTVRFERVPGDDLGEQVCPVQPVDDRQY